mmetsp:Transcript_23285/g.45916  ORF Transcript_23285/g.45916 Transcript_23285/m.45916 type:complete len:244 (-) Transcript_23285:247-978(-)|eukprot:CAMPEP_0175149748 /NCGR_PEP_ID=MMETSP0087-20121206/17439_1 /TAXON_ID=136419 /ORGANISM="Unknown Unknown, Strain D1" /LENGTH=243 /DNA_ID=CAMNT_0016435521 /DNA_START=15 /DNA_END=746 /DNA_ORIENTATION=-
MKVVWLACSLSCIAACSYKPVVSELLNSLNTREASFLQTNAKTTKTSHAAQVETRNGDDPQDEQISSSLNQLFEDVAKNHLPPIDAAYDFRSFQTPVTCNFKAFADAQKYLKELKTVKSKLIEATETAQKAFAAELKLSIDYHLNHPCNKKMIDDYILGIEALQSLVSKIDDTDFMVMGIVGACAAVNAPIQQGNDQQLNAVQEVQRSWNQNFDSVPASVPTQTAPVFDSWSGNMLNGAFQQS